MTKVTTFNLLDLLEPDEIVQEVTMNMQLTQRRPSWWEPFTRFRRLPENLDSTILVRTNRRDISDCQLCSLLANKLDEFNLRSAQLVIVKFLLGSASLQDLQSTLWFWNQTSWPRYFCSSISDRPGYWETAASRLSYVTIVIANRTRKSLEEVIAMWDKFDQHRPFLKEARFKLSGDPAEYRALDWLEESYIPFVTHPPAQQRLASIAKQMLEYATNPYMRPPTFDPFNL